MPDPREPYVPAKPGDLFTAEMWKEMQLRIQQDIATTTEKAVGEIHEVDRAGDAAKLDGKTPRDLADEIVERAVRELRERSGYRCIFTVLEADEPRKIEHKLGLAPLVDVYRLLYFPVVYREDDQTYLSWATFFLRHSSESRIRFSSEVSVELESPTGPVFKIKLADLLERYRVPFDDDSSLEDLETELWQAFFASPNEGFDDDQYGHSPWFERCCKEKTSVRQLKRAGDWDEIWLQMMPVKQAIFLPFKNSFEGWDPTALSEYKLSPAIVDVFHTDFDTTVLALRPTPEVTYSEEKGWKDRLSRLAGWTATSSPLLSIIKTFPNATKELKVMILLKV